MEEPIRLGISGTRRESTVRDRRKGRFALDGFRKTQESESTKERGGVVNLETRWKVRVRPFHEAVVCWIELVQRSAQNVREN